MSATYNLNEQVGSDYFEFELDGFKYKMNYPSSQDILNIQDMADDTMDYQTKIKEVTEKIQLTNEEDKSNLSDQLNELSQKAKLSQQSFLEWCVGYVVPEGDAPNIKEALLKKNVKYLLAFIEMVRVELGE